MESADLAKMAKGGSTRTRCRLVGATIAGARPFVTEPNLYNATKALLCRVFRRPNHNAELAAWMAVSRLDKVLLGELFGSGFQPMTVDEWMAEAEPRRRAAFERARVDLEMLGWSDLWAWFSSFLKAEKLPWWEPHQGGDCTPLPALVDRLIQGPHDCTHLIAGPLLKPLTKRLKEVWNWESPIFYAAVSVEKLDSWFNRNYTPGMWGLCCDYSMFDNSHSTYSWHWVESIYRRMGFFEMDPRFEKVMEAWREPQGRLHGKGWTLKYKAYVMNASGRDDTSLANALLNGACMFLSLAAIFSGKEVESLTPGDIIRAKRIIHLSVCGDDSLALLPELPGGKKSFMAALSKTLARFGFDAGADKMKVSQNPFDFVYLAMRPYPHSGRWWFAKTIGRAIWKLGWQMDPSGDAQAWMAGNAKQVTATQQIVPLLSDVAQAYLKGYSGPVRHEVDAHRPWQRSSETPAYDDSVIDYVCTGYDLGRAELADAIAHCRSIPQFPWVLDHSALRRILAVDEM